MTHLSEAILRDTNGISLVLHDPLVVQSLRDRADFFLLDNAARGCGFETIANLLAAAKDTSFLVRPACSTRSTLLALLNMGVDGLVLPDIHHAAELEKVIAACLYPPEGVRSYYPTASQDKIALDAVNDQITFLVDIAHPQTVSQLEEIAEVTGINGLLVNPQRLSVAMEKGGNVDDPALRQTLKTIARVAANYELPLGLEGENIFDLQPDFVIPSRDIDLLLGNTKIRNTFYAEEDEEDDFSPVLLSARRE